MESVLKCSVCLGGDTALVNTWTTDLNNIKWSYKLRLCVPEVEWYEDHLICRTCINQLETAYEFRDLCIKSFAIRNCSNKPNKYSNNDTPPDNTPISIYICRNCVGVSFRTANELAQHKINVHFMTERPYNCVCCEKDFETSLELIHHEVTHFNMFDYKNGYTYNPVNSATACQQLGDTNLQLSKVAYLDNDLQKKQNDSAYNCYACEKYFDTKVSLISHLDSCNFFAGKRVIIKGEPAGCEKLKCDECLSLFSTESEMNNHHIECSAKQSNVNNPQDGKRNNGISEVKAVSGSITKRLTSVRVKKRGRRKKLDPVSNACSVCDMVFNTQYLVKRHVRNVHAAEKNYQCNVCQQKFASPVYLNAHKRYHSGERSHICLFCGKGFITGSDLYHHEKIHANKRAYKCEKCLKAFNTSSDLHKHKLCVHLDKSQWKYVCTFCDRRFPLKTNLDAHTKTHTGERNFACHLCDRKCVNRSVLMRHVKSHSNVRLFKCSLCQLEYKYQKSLDIHMVKMHGIGDAKVPERVKKYFCHICPKSYFANNKLQKHIRTHTGERPFSCQMCDKRFIDKSYVKQHLKTTHNVTFNQTDM